jgi:hypothetical protein
MAEILNIQANAVIYGKKLLVKRRIQIDAVYPKKSFCNVCPKIFERGDKYYRTKVEITLFTKSHYLPKK